MNYDNPVKTAGFVSTIIVLSQARQRLVKTGGILKMNGSVLAEVHRGKIMRRFLDGQRVSSRVYVHTTANEAEKNQQGDVMDLLLSSGPHIYV